MEGNYREKHMNILQSQREFQPSADRITVFFFSTYHFYIILISFQIVKYLCVIFYFWVVIFFEKGDLTAGAHTSGIGYRVMRIRPFPIRFIL